MFPPEPDSPRLTLKEWWSDVVLPTLFLGLVIVALAGFAYTSTKELVRNNIENELHAIARLKVGQIERWTARRHDDAEMIATPQFRQDLKSWLDGKQRDEALRQRLLRQITVSAEVTEPRTFDIHAPDGRVLLSTSTTPDTEAAQQIARDIAQSGHEHVEPLHFALAPRRPGQHRPPLRQGYLSPLRLDKDSAVIAVLHSRVNPESVLFPMLQTWPGNSPSAETMILRQEGDRILYLNDLRHLPDSALQISRPITGQKLIATEVITHGEGFYEAIDYRGIASLGYGMAVPHSPLFLIAKIDRDEVFHDINTLALFLSVLCFLALSAFAVWLLHRKQYENHLNHLLEERQQMQDQLVVTQDRLRELAGHDDAIREAERKHLARELHDELGQLLTALKMHLSLLQMQFDHIPELLEKTEAMRHIVEKAITTVRTTVSHLRPPTLDLGLAGALEWQAEEFTRDTCIPCEFENGCIAPCLETETAAIAFRLVQESLTNVARHAQASKVVIRMNCAGESGSGAGILRLSITDDGKGFDVDEALKNRKNFGLIGMQERVTLLHGQIRLTSQPGQGTRIHIEFPFTPTKPSCPYSS